MRVLLLAINDELVATLLAATFGTQWRLPPLVRTVEGLRLGMECWKPTVAITSLVLGEESVTGSLQQLANRHSTCSIIVCQHGLDPGVREWLLLAGVKAVIDHGTSAEQLRTGLESLLLTGDYRPHAESGASDSGHMSNNDPVSDGMGATGTRDLFETVRRPLVPLVHRERELLTHFQLGHSHEQAAAAMGIRRKTVEHFSHSLRRKFGFPPRLRTKWANCRPG